jgi:hypothetical protein
MTHYTSWRLDFDLAVKPDVKRIEDLYRTFKSDSKIFIAIVSGDLRLMHTEPPREFSL